MLKNIIHFIKYNNATVLILGVVFLLGSGVFASTEVGQEIIGEEEVRIEGADNLFLLEIVLDDFDMNFKIEKIEEDSEYYYAIYTYLDLAEVNAAWQPLIVEKVRKVSKKLKEDLGVYLAEELGEEQEARMKELKEAQAEAREGGKETRVEVTEYSGLIGNTLDLAARIFPGYEPVKKREMPSPVFTDAVYESEPVEEIIPVVEIVEVKCEDTPRDEGCPLWEEEGIIATTTPEEIVEEEEAIVEKEVATTTPEEL